MSKREVFRLEELKRLMNYMLSRRPDEFGLLPDSEGYVKIKELIQALHEEGLSFVRDTHINEIMMQQGTDMFEIDEDRKRIRAKEIYWNIDINPTYEVPKLLYTCVRRRAYPVILENGLFSDTYIMLSSSKEVALRIGKRKDTRPVLLEIIAHEAMDQGAIFFSFGELYLSKWIPSQCISGPPLDREEKPQKKESKKKEKIKEAFSSGTFIMKKEEKHKKGKKKKTWKEEARKTRKRKDFDFF